MSALTSVRRALRSSSVGLTCLTKSTCAPCGAQTRNSASLTPRPIDCCISEAKSSESPSHVRMSSTVPMRASAIRRTSATCHAAPSPRQSAWNLPRTCSMDHDSSWGVSCWLAPSVSRIAWRLVKEGTVPKSWAAASSHRPMAVPPPGARRCSERLASSRVWGDIRAIDATVPVG